VAFNESLAERVRVCLGKENTAFEEKRMMGGLCFLVRTKMCLGVEQDRLMVRLDPAIYEEAVRRPGCTPMDFTGRPMRGFVWVEAAAINSGPALSRWVRLALDFNPRAKASKKAKRKSGSVR